jgi:predicted transcriptional regulator
MTVEELKAEAAKLPPDARFALAEWIERSDDVRALRREELIREIQHGIEQADRGDLLESDEVFARLRAGQRATA